MAHSNAWRSHLRRGSKGNMKRSYYWSLGLVYMMVQSKKGGGWWGPPEQ